MSGGNFSITNFRQSSSLIQLQHSATILPGGTLLLTSNARNLLGRAFFKSPLTFFAYNSHLDWQARFSFRLYGRTRYGADGISLVFCASIPVSYGYGGSHGYKDVAKSVAVRIDPYLKNELGICLNGQPAPVKSLHVPGSFQDGRLWDCWVDYLGEAKVLEVRVSNDPSCKKPHHPTLSLGVDLWSVIQQDTFYTGLFAATGDECLYHAVDLWSFTSTAHPRFKGKANVGFVGITSCGKSTLINTLAKKEVAKTGIDETTKEIAPVWALDSLLLWDFPGFNDQVGYLDPKFAGLVKSFRMVYVLYDNDFRVCLKLIRLLQALKVPYALIRTKCDSTENARKTNLAEVANELRTIRERDAFSLAASGVDPLPRVYHVSCRNVRNSMKILDYDPHAAVGGLYEWHELLRDMLALRPAP